MAIIAKWSVKLYSLITLSVCKYRKFSNGLAFLSIIIVNAFLQMLHLLRSSIFGFIQNLAVDSACWLHFEPTRFVDILKIHTKTLDKGICFMSLYTLSLLVEVIPVEKRGVLYFEQKVIREYIDILTTAVSSPNLEATKVFGSLVIPADDILRFLKQLWYVEPNRCNIGPLLSSLIFPIETCLQRGNEMQQMAAMDLLWTLISEPTLLPQVQAGIDLKLIEKLVKADVSSNVLVMTSCILYKIHPEVIKTGKQYVCVGVTWGFMLSTCFLTWETPNL